MGGFLRGPPTTPLRLRSKRDGESSGRQNVLNLIRGTLRCHDVSQLTELLGRISVIVGRQPLEKGLRYLRGGGPAAVSVTTIGLWSVAQPSL